MCPPFEEIRNTIDVDSESPAPWEKSGIPERVTGSGIFRRNPHNGVDCHGRQFPFVKIFLQGRQDQTKKVVEGSALNEGGLAMALDPDPPSDNPLAASAEDMP
jgi:hypothetical protein